KPFQIDEVLARVEAQLDAHDRIREMQEKVEQLNEQLDARNEEDDDVPRAERVRALIESGETETCEFKSTIRRNLKSGKNDKAMEKAWLKTIVALLNSEGGTLLIGVDDGGGILGLDVDQFSNDDHAQLHVNNLIRNHIGPEYAQFIRIGICELDEKSVLTFTCSRSGPPSFLKLDDAEDVYIRMGPGSRKLTTREAMEYFEARESK
ncbi:MAG: ATP-binding protein, partial [Planctomycetota bacterium]|nr:ATP-binding protein [Planctomycetota bacterium]